MFNSSSASFLSEDDSKNISKKSIPEVENSIKTSAITVSDDYFTVEIPEKIRSIFLKSEKVNFIFRFVKGNKMNFLGPKCYSVYVLFFEEFIQNIKDYTEIPEKIFFIIQKEKYISQKKRNLDKSFKESVKNNLEKNISDKNNLNIKNNLEKNNLNKNIFDSEKINMDIFEFQFVTQINFVEIENTVDLIDQINNLISILQKNEEYEIKVKKCCTSLKEEFLLNLLLQIPGVGKGMASGISKEYKSICSLTSKLIENPDLVKNTRIFDSSYNQERLIGDRLFNKLVDIFLSGDYDKLI